MKTWGHWCYDQEPVHLPINQPRCSQCGSIHLRTVVDVMLPHEDEPQVTTEYLNDKPPGQ